ncbi:hypothetical protein VB776_17365 [Arcicella sp. DC2W]|uniref:Uncharacterized protein n=1 Tax=Arcicella gelida TaxID=2984195 RepID=A0ABU5S8A4_9BACT|nr:hypothetical protein [Arcicella sp. DC2W]MEA5404707.1 hypothetical protein [Arcicella sp. DC2W]
MIQLQSPAFTFNIFPHQEKLRLVVFNNDEEYVCRIESKKTLYQFLEENNARLFKGRLQLIKNQKELFVQVKGEIVGELSIDVFKELLTTQSTL